MPAVLQGSTSILPVWGLHRLTVKQYQKMITDGVFAEDERVELIDGLLVDKMPHDPIHDGTISLLLDAIMRIAPAGWCPRVQGSITLSTSEPEPDFVLARGNKRTYLARHPGPSDIGLVVEVSNSSLQRDRSDKLRVYAKAGLPTYWIMNVLDMQIEVFTQPVGAVYTVEQIWRRGDAVPLELDGVPIGTISANDLLP
jgi:Uma2 family endonuclease